MPAQVSIRRRLAEAVLLVVLLAIPASQVLRHDAAVLGRARREAAGIEPIRRALAVVRATQRHRGLAGGMLAGDVALDAPRARAAEDLERALAESRRAAVVLRDLAAARQVATIAVHWRELRASVEAGGLGGRESFGRHTELVEAGLLLVRRLADASQLSLHGEPVGHHLQIAVIDEMPRVAEYLGRLRGEGTRMLAARTASPADRAILAAAREGALLELTRAHASWMASGLEPGVVWSTAAALVDEIVALVDRDLLSADRLTASPAAYFEAVTVAIDAQFALADEGFRLLRGQLEGARRDARRDLVLDLALAALLLTFGLWMLLLTHRAQRARELSDRRCRAIIEHAPDAVLVVDAGGRLAEANPAALRLCGPTVVGTPATELWADAHAGSLRSDLEAVQATGATAVAEVRRVSGRRADGTTFPAEAVCFGADAGDDREMIVMMRDVTERERLERQLAQSHKMEALGQLTGGLAHDFNNLLGVVVGNLDLLDRSLVGQDAARRRVETARKAALRGSDVTRRLLAFSRRQHLEPAPLALAEAVSTVVEMAGRTLGREVTLRTRLDDEHARIMADASAFESALLNLLVNARDAMPQGGTIEIVAATIDVDELHPAVRAGELSPGRYASLRVADTGQGIPPSQVDKVFEPFFTTKGPGKGTGLGLAMVYGFVKQSGGHIKIYSEVGVGTTVAIVLPLAAADAAAVDARGPDEVDHRARAGATALVVDDEPDLREIAATYLEGMGYRVVTAGDGPSALRALANEPAVDVLVTDVIMPGGMNGVRLSQRARRARPSLRVVFTSGFPSQALAQRNGTRIDGPLVNKPFQLRELASALNRAIAGAPP